MNEPTSGASPGGSGGPHGHRPLPAAPPHGQARRPLAAPGGGPRPQPPQRHQPPDPDPERRSHATTEATASAVRAEPAPPDASAPDVPGDDPAAHRLRDDEGTLPPDLRAEPTGHPSVDDRLERLEDAHHLPVSAHLEVYEDVHRGLRDTLTALDRHDPRS